MINSVAIFKWTGALPSDDEVGADTENRYSNDFGEQWAYQACRPVANAVFEGMRDQGYQSEPNSIAFDETGWSFRVMIEGQSYSVFIQWIANEDRNDTFAAEPALCRNWFASLFYARPANIVLRPICEALNRILVTNPLVADLKWVSEIPR